MTTDQLDAFEPKEQSKASSSKVAAPVRARAHASSAGADASSGESFAQSQPKRHFADPQPQTATGRTFGLQGSQSMGFLVAFAAGSIAALFLFAVLALGVGGGSGKALNGVHVGTVDVSGLTRDQVVAKLQTEFAYLSQGEITVNTPVGSDKVKFAEAGRSADIDVMADAALSIGHSGNPVSDSIAALHTAILGQTVPVVVKLDPTVLAERVHQLVGASEVESKNAVVTGKSGTFTFTPSQVGKGIDESQLSTAIIDQLVLNNPASSVQSNATFVELRPQVNDSEAQAAIAKAQKMTVTVKLTWGDKNWTLDANTIKSWIAFGWQADGKYGPALDPSKTQPALSALTAKANIPAVEPQVVWDPATGTPKSLTAGKDGTGVDTAATTAALTAYLEAVAAGGTASGSLEVVTSPIRPQIANVDNVKGMAIIGKWTTTFFPGESNGNGANIRVPAKLLNGLVIGPGQQFSFLNSVGPIDAAHGFAMGGVIIRGQSDHTGAIGGGICSASTTVFNAAATAGLQIDERHSHAYWVNRYPIGRDATVFSNGTSLYDFKFTNDTNYPIVIRSWATYGNTSTVTFQFWSLPTGRTVTWSGGTQANIIPPTDGKRYVSTLAPGKTYRAEYPTPGFDTVVTRTVKDSTGTVLHANTWQSHYVKVDGILQIGGTPPPSGGTSPSPSKLPSPTPVITPPPAVTPSPTAPARRRREDLVEA